MKCYNCSNVITTEEVCPYCGADVHLYKKIIYKSNSLYNEGLEKAKVRDLTGALICLKESLQINKRNTDARNLLGLCYYEQGEAVLAFSEWIISRSYDSSKENAAIDYIDRLQSNQATLSTINQTLKKFNQALQYCYQGSVDLAIIQLKKVISVNEKLVRAYQLLALCYMQTEDYMKARRTLLRALRIDAGNTRILTYLNETNRIIRENDAQTTTGKKKKKTSQTTDVYTYESGNDVIIQPVFEQEKIGYSSVINIVIGLVVGVAICCFLVLPARIQITQQKFDESYKEVSEKLAAEEATHNQDKITLSSVTEERDNLKKEVNELKGLSGNKRPIDFLLEAAGSYVSNPLGTTAIMESLEGIKEEDLSKENEAFNNLYNRLRGESGPKMVESYVDDAKAAMKSSDYDRAIDLYIKASELAPDNSDIIMSLAHAYRQKGDIDVADELYKKIIKDFAGTQNAIDAESYVENSREGNG